MYLITSITYKLGSREVRPLTRRPGRSPGSQASYRKAGPPTGRLGRSQAGPPKGRPAPLQGAGALTGRLGLSQEDRVARPLTGRLF